MDFPAFEHAAWLAAAWQHSAPRHNLGASGFVPDDPLEGLPRELVAEDIAGLDLHSGTAYRDAVAQHLDLPAEAVRPAAGTSSANLAVIARFVRPGSTVVCERPYYAPMPHIAQGLGARVRFVERGPDGRLDPHDVDDALAHDTSLVLLTSPNNPTGHALDAAAMRHLGESAERFGAHVLIDQVFAELTDHARAAGLHPHIIVTSGFNKCWGAPGLRAGWVAGDPALLDGIEEIHRLFVAGPSPAGTRVATALLQQADHRRAMLEQRLRANHEVFQQRVPGLLGARAPAAERPPVTETAARRVAAPNAALPDNAAADAAAAHAAATDAPPHAAGNDATAADARGIPHGDLFAFLPARQADSLIVARELLAHGILTVPGELFGRPGHLRIGLGIPTAALEAALDALVARLQ